MDSDHPGGLKIDRQSTPVNVPAFTCVVYVSQSKGGDVHARVANLGDIETDATTEREALARIVPAFKQQVAQFLADGQPIPWIDPPMPRSGQEQERLLPVHL